MFVWRSTYNKLCDAYEKMVDSNYDLKIELLKLKSDHANTKAALKKAQKNDHRGPDGKFKKRD